MNALETRIVEEVEKRRSRIVSFVQRLIQIHSITGNEKEIGDVIYHEMKSIGLEPVELVEKEPGRPNVIGVLKGDRQGKRLLFNGHMDVVPYGPSDEWEYPPTSGKIVGSRLHGRGTVDMKTGLASSILATEIIKILQVPFGGTVILTAVCDEEVGGAKGTRYLIGRGYMQADMGINCEATDLKSVDVVHKGIYQCDITVSGRAIHGSRPWLGINAVDKAVDVMNRLRVLERQLRLRKHPLLQPPTINVGTISGGTVINMIPSQCIIGINRRLIPGESFENVEGEIMAILDELRKEDPEFKAELRRLDVNLPVLEVDPDAEVVKAIQRAHQTVRGEALRIGGKDAGTDAAWIASGTGMPMPIYGPGDYLRGSLAANESIEIQDILDAVKVYALAIYYLLGERR